MEIETQKLSTRSLVRPERTWEHDFNLFRNIRASYNSSSILQLLLSDHFTCTIKEEKKFEYAPTRHLSNTLHTLHHEEFKHDSSLSENSFTFLISVMPQHTHTQSSFHSSCSALYCWFFMTIESHSQGNSIARRRDSLNKFFFTQIGLNLVFSFEKSSQWPLTRIILPTFTRHYQTNIFSSSGSKKKKNVEFSGRKKRKRRWERLKNI